MRRYSRGKINASSYEVNTKVDITPAPGVVVLLDDSMFRMDYKDSSSKTRPCLIVDEFERAGELYFTIAPMSTKYRDEAIAVKYNNQTSYVVEEKSITMSEDRLLSLNKGIKGYASY